MKGAFKLLIWIVVLAVLGFAAWQAYEKVQQRQQTTTTTEPAQEPLRVSAVRIRTATLTRSVPVTGELEALAVVDVVPKVTGRLESLRLSSGKLIEEGASVQKGQVIALIEHRALEAAVETAKAAVEVAKAAHQRTKVSCKDAEREKKRWETLYQKGSATELQRDQMATAYERCFAELRFTEAQISQAEAALRQTEVNLREATIESPITGVVSQKYVDEGDMVGPAMPLLRIVAIDTVKVVGGVSERHLSALVPGKTPARLSVDAYPAEEFEGVVCNVGTDIDRLTRTVQVEVRVPNTEQRLKPGMFARLSLAIERRENVTVVADSALLRQGAQVYVYVVKGSKANRRNLTLGLSQGPRHEVIEGLRPGEMVVVRGQHMLQDGDRVVVVEEDQQ